MLQDFKSQFQSPSFNRQVILYRYIFTNKHGETFIQERYFKKGQDYVNQTKYSWCRCISRQRVQLEVDEKIGFKNEASNKCNGSYFKNFKVKDFNQATLFQKNLIGDRGTNLDEDLVQKPVFQHCSKPITVCKKQSKREIFKHLIFHLANQLKEKQLQRNFIGLFTKILLITIEPTNSFMYIWNFLNILIIFHHIFAIPLSDAFQDKYLTQECMLTQTLIKVEVLFLFLDILVLFNVKILRRGELLENKKMIAKAYLRNGFIQDVLPFLSFVIYKYNVITTDNCLNIQPTLFTTIIKYLFLLKLFRLSKLIAFFQHQFVYNNNIKNYLRLVSLLFKLVYVAHLFACCWIIIARWSAIFNDHNWITSLDGQQNSINIYIKSIYFACYTMTTVGYGDITPVNDVEYLLSVVMMILSSGIFAYSLNTITQILQDLESSTKVYTRELGIISNYMRKRNINKSLQDRIINYLQCIQEAGLNDDAEQENKILDKLSVSLRHQLQLQDKGIMFKNTLIFEETFSSNFLEQLSELVQTIRFSPGETIKNQNDEKTFADDYFYIVKGQVQLEYENISKVDYKENIKKFQLCSLQEKDSWGLLNLFRQNNQHQKFSMVSKDFTLLYVLRKQDFENLLYSENFINSYDKIIYCKMRDDVRNYNDLSNFIFKCQLCDQNGHELYECHKLFFRPCKNLVLGKYDFSVPQERQVLKRKDKPKHRTLISMEKHKKYIKDIQQLLDWGNDDIHYESEEQQSKVNSWNDLEDNGSSLFQRKISEEALNIEKSPLTEQVHYLCFQLIIQQVSDCSDRSWQNDLDEQIITIKKTGITTSDPVQITNSQLLNPLMQSQNLFHLHPVKQNELQSSLYVSNYISSPIPVKPSMYKPKGSVSQSQSISLQTSSIQASGSLLRNSSHRRNVQKSPSLNNKDVDKIQNKPINDDLQLRKSKNHVSMEQLQQLIEQIKGPNSWVMKTIQEQEQQEVGEFEMAKDFTYYFEHNNVKNVIKNLNDQISKQKKKNSQKKKSKFQVQLLKFTLKT